MGLLRGAGDYWRLWNMPVHKWMLRTVYYPAISFGTGRCMAGIIVFLASAIFHELLVGVPLRMNQFPYWSFLGIMGQASHPRPPQCHHRCGSRIAFRSTEVLQDD